MGFILMKSKKASRPSQGGLLTFALIIKTIMLFTNIEFAKTTIFLNISKYLIKKSAFFNFFLEIEQIIAIFAPAIMPDMGLLKLKKKKRRQAHP